MSDSSSSLSLLSHSLSCERQAAAAAAARRRDSERGKRQALPQSLPSAPSAGAPSGGVPPQHQVLANLNALHTIIFFPDFCRCLEGWYAEGLKPLSSRSLLLPRAKPRSLQASALESPSPSSDSSPRMACNDPVVRFREICPPHLHQFVPPTSTNAFT